MPKQISDKVDNYQYVSDSGCAIDAFQLDRR